MWPLFFFSYNSVSSPQTDSDVMLFDVFPRLGNHFYLRALSKSSIFIFNLFSTRGRQPEHACSFTATSCFTFTLSHTSTWKLPNQHDTVSHREAVAVLRCVLFVIAG